MVCRYLAEASGQEFIGEEGNPVKAYEIGEAAKDQLGPELENFDEQACIKMLSMPHTILHDCLQSHLSNIGQLHAFIAMLRTSSADKHLAH